MRSAPLLKRSAMIGLRGATLAIVSTLARPTATAEASVLPDSRSGAPDIGYPGCPSSCHILDGTPLTGSDEIVAAKQSLYPSGWGDGTPND